MIKAAIDIGTNTAHLIIGKPGNDRDGFESILTKRFYIFLGKDGLEHISNDARNRLMKALSVFKDLITEYQVETVRIVGTEALRKASNGGDVLKCIKDRWNWEVDIISGLAEARYVYYGVRQAINLNRYPHLIMDIGGGSVEFILTNQKGIHWSTSLPLGIAKLYNRFHKADPISSAEINEIDTYLDHSLVDLFARVDSLKTTPILIGSAGSFEIFPSLTKDSDPPSPHFEVLLSSFEEYYKMVVPMGLKSRQCSKYIPKERANYIVVALVLIRHVLNHLNSKSFLVSRYALKEGVLLS